MPGLAHSTQPAVPYVDEFDSRQTDTESGP